MADHELSDTSESLGPTVALAAGSDSQWPSFVVSSTDGDGVSLAALPRETTVDAGSIARQPQVPDFSRANGAGTRPASPSAPRIGRRRVVIGAVVLLAIAAAGRYYGAPYVHRALSTVSTDDAYVNGHVTFVAPRVMGQVESVLVDDNDHVHKGDVLVRLDKQPYQVAVDIKRAAYEVAQQDVTVARDDVRAMIAKARAARFKLQHAIEDVDNQLAILRANVAKLGRADADYKRAINLQKQPGVISDQEVDLFKESYRVALQQVYQTRVSLGLPEQPKSGDLSESPADLDQTFSTVRQALAELQEAAAPLGIASSSFDLTPKALLDEFYKRDPRGNIDNILAKIAADAPTIKLAEAKLQQARADLDQSELDLKYCDIVAEIDGVVTRRQVNPGNNVVVGQSLMAVRSLTEIWVDANFKETQLARLKIGQAVDLEVDMYGDRRTFQGRISGFTMGTGSALALLPAENATGNFVKVVQRLPVRIELLDYDPNEAPLFIGLSVTPYVLINDNPTGPDAGRVLRPWSPGGQTEKRS